MDIDALVEELEQASEGSRELDAAIYTAVTGYPTSLSAEIIAKPCDVDGNYVQQFSASLDAAMDLVPDACVVGLQWRFGGTVRAELYRSGEGNIGHAIGNSGPLAICLVSLSARASQSKAA